MRIFFAALMICLLTVSSADARSRHKARHQARPAGDGLAVSLLRKQATELGALRQELADIRKLLRPQVASIDPEMPTEPARNPVTIVTPMPLPDVTVDKSVIGLSNDNDRLHSIHSTKGLGNIHGLQSGFIAKLAALRAAMPAGMGFAVGSGFRSHSEQARLHAMKPRLAARPGHSNHERGLAGDLRFASRESARWVHRYAYRHGLRFPMSYEPWHIEPVGATRTRYAQRKHRYAQAR